nr:uncharacterized protein LOC127315919 [Lolium perenne]
MTVQRSKSRSSNKHPKFEKRCQEALPENELANPPRAKAAREVLPELFPASRIGWPPPLTFAAADRAVSGRRVQGSPAAADFPRPYRAKIFRRPGFDGEQHGARSIPAAAGYGSARRHRLAHASPPPPPAPGPAANACPAAKAPVARSRPAAAPASPPTPPSTATAASQKLQPKQTDPESATP